MYSLAGAAVDDDNDENDKEGNPNDDTSNVVPERQAGDGRTVRYMVYLIRYIFFMERSYALAGINLYVDLFPFWIFSNTSFLRFVTTFPKLSI